MLLSAYIAVYFGMLLQLYVCIDMNVQLTVSEETMGALKLKELTMHEAVASN